MRKEFPYLAHRGQQFPVIDVEIKGQKGNSIAVKALIDSGASFSVFHYDIAQYLNIPVNQGKKIYLEGIGGRILGYLHSVPLKIDEKQFNCKIIFSPEYTVSFNLLGRDNFFHPFFITFKEHLKMVELEDYESRH